MNSELICPFCKGKVRVAICDDEGNIHDDGYKDDPWSGLGYLLVHEEKDVPKGKHCPIATFDRDELGLGTMIYDSREEAEEAWNIK